MTRLLLLVAAGFALNAPESARGQSRADDAPVRLITLNPGHFHAGLIQKFMVADVSPVVRVYAPAGADVADHLKRIESFNTRPIQPTRWREQVYTGKDYFDKMLKEKAGNVVVISGNNLRKTEYIARSIDAGFNVLADKPMVITPSELPRLRKAFVTADDKGVLLADIMTERFEITNILQRELSRNAALFGELVRGTPEYPAITKVSVHHFSKTVAGSALKRPQWFFDVRQQGEGIVDVMTHLVDLVQWAAFPEQVLNPEDAEVWQARRWATPITRDQFSRVTGAKAFPAFLKKDVKGGVLQVFANGEFIYLLRGVHARVSVSWDFEAPPGAGDTHQSFMRGTKANLIIRQGEAERFKPVLYVENVSTAGGVELEARLSAAVDLLQDRYPGVGFRREGRSWVITVPEKYDVGHEAHFAQVADYYMRALRLKKLPEWEAPGMVTKYSTIMKALEMSQARR